MQKKVLGRGLSTILGNANNIQNANNNASGESVVTIPLNKIQPNRYQPRKKFDEAKLAELADSIKQHGLAQPILVTPAVRPGEYELIAGERRFRASKIAGKTDIRAIVKKATTDKERFHLALIENIQRENLDPVEEAKSYKRLIEEFQHTHDDIAKAVGKNRSVVSNALRLLNLPDDVQGLISEGKISAGHARALINLGNENEIRSVVDKILNDKLSVRDVEEISSGIKNAKVAVPKEPKKQEIEIVNMKEEMQRKFGTKVNIVGNNKKGKIEIRYFSLQDLERIAKELNIQV